MPKGLGRSLSRGTGKNLGHRFDISFDSSGNLTDSSGSGLWSTMQVDIGKRLLVHQDVTIVGGALNLQMTYGGAFPENLDTDDEFEVSLGTAAIVDPTTNKPFGDAISLMSPQGGNVFQSGGTPTYDRDFELDGSSAHPRLNGLPFILSFSWRPDVVAFGSQNNISVDGQLHLQYEVD